MSGLLTAAKILLQHGGIFPYLNICTAGLALIIIIERLLKLAHFNAGGDAFMGPLVKLIREGQIDRARKWCQAAPNSVLSHVMQAGIESSNRGEAEISAALEESSMEVTPKVTGWIPALFPLANIATLIGLIGTISGLIKSFSALSQASPDQKAAILATGISEAMYNTAFGLLIAVTCIAAQLFLANKAKKMIEEVELNAIKLENLLARRLAAEAEASPQR